MVPPPAEAGTPNGGGAGNQNYGRYGRMESKNPTGKPVG